MTEEQVWKEANDQYVRLYGDTYENVLFAANMKQGIERLLLSRFRPLPPFGWYRTEVWYVGDLA